MENYYIKQAGNGLPLQVFAGTRYQRGNGFFGRFLTSKILPLLRYLGSQALDTGKAIFEDTKNSAANHVSETVGKIASDAIQHIATRRNKQEGAGRKVIKRALINRKKKSLNKTYYDFLK